MIYLLEDDDSIRDFVIYTLNSQGMEARGFPLPSLFWQAVGEQMPALVLLDINANDCKTTSDKEDHWWTFTALARC